MVGRRRLGGVLAGARHRDRSTVKRRQHRALTAYVDELQDSLGLTHWDIGVLPCDPPAKIAEGCAAAILVQNEADVADLAVVWKRFRGFTRAEQRAALVHELCHLVMRPFLDRTLELYEPISSDRRGRKAAAASLTVAMGQANDGFARRLAEHLPLPPRAWLD